MRKRKLNHFGFGRKKNSKFFYFWEFCFLSLFKFWFFFSILHFSKFFSLKDHLSSISIASAEQSDAGTYAIFVRNEHGMDSAQFSVAVEDATCSASASGVAHVPQQISSWLGRQNQKLSNAWRLKKHFSASQSSLPDTNNSAPSAGDKGTNSHGTTTVPPKVANFSKSFNEPQTSKGVANKWRNFFEAYINLTNFLGIPFGLPKFYHKGKGMKNSIGDLTQIGKSQPELY